MFRIVYVALWFVVGSVCALGQDSGFASTPPTQFNASFTLQMTNVPQGIQPMPSALTQGEVIYPPPQGNMQMMQPGLAMPQQQPKLIPQPVEEKTFLDRCYLDHLFNYTWIDFGDDPGLRIHRLEFTNAWADFRAANFFTRSIEACNHHVDAGLSFGVQWWKEQPGINNSVPGDHYFPPTLYDLYLDLGWRTALSSTWMIDLALSPGFSTDFRVTPPDGFRLKGHAITMVDMLPNLRGVLGVWYINRNSTKILPVAGFSWQANDATRIEAIFPQPRIVQTLGCWRGTTWEASIGGEFGGGGWAFKNDGNDRETIDYRDLRLLVGLGCNGKHGQATLQAGYVFNRQLQYGTQQNFDFDPGNAWMVRLSWDY